MNGEPCRNPYCKSFGKTHPNCRCYVAGAGGEGLEGESGASGAPMTASEGLTFGFPVGKPDLVPAGGSGGAGRGGGASGSAAASSSVPSIPKTGADAAAVQPDYEAAPVLKMSGQLERLGLEGIGFAKGGEVEHFCSNCQPHGPDCEYYSAGGDVVPANELISSIGANSPGIVPANELASSGASGADDLVPASELGGLPSGLGRYDTPGQQVLAGLEGAAKGFAGPLATVAELGLSKLGVPGLTGADIAGREAAHPKTHMLGEAAGLAGGLFTGAGEAALLEKGAVGLTKIFGLGKLATSATTAVLGGAGIAAGDEISRALQNSDDPNAVSETVPNVLAHIGAGGLFGLGGAAAFNLAGKVGANLAEQIPAKVGTKLLDYVSGIGGGIKARESGIGGPELADLLSRATSDVSSAYRKGMQHGFGLDAEIAMGLAETGTRGIMGSFLGIPGGVVGSKAIPIVGAAIQKTLAQILQPCGKHAARVVSPVVQWLANGGDGRMIMPALGAAASFSKAALKGADKYSSDINSLFQSGAQAYGNTSITESNRQNVKDYISSGGLDTELQNTQAEQMVPRSMQQFAKGGEVSKPKTLENNVFPKPGFSEVYPQHNVLLQTAKARVFNYLKGMQPGKDAPRLAFDEEPDQTDKKRTYDRAIDIALDPTSVLSHVKNGTIEPEHLQHLNAMYPELAEHMRKQVTGRISKAQLDKEVPDFKVKQGLSALLGVPLDGVLTQANMAAIQACFVPKQAPGQQPAPKGKKGTPGLSKASGSYLTGDQAREQRQQTAS